MVRSTPATCGAVGCELGRGHLRHAAADMQPAAVAAIIAIAAVAAIVAVAAVP